MNRELTDHKVNGCNASIDIEVDDLPGAGGASHRYLVSGLNKRSNPSLSAADDPQDDSTTVVLFQQGPIQDGVEPNGVTHEILLAILIDRLRSFQDGPFKCRENALALTKLEEAMHWLHARTKARVARGVEGTLQV